MQYIPVKQNELIEVQCKTKINEVDVEVTFITLPCCGDNELEVMKLSNVEEGDTRRVIDVYRDIINYLCKGYMLNGNRVIFTGGEKASDYFNLPLAKWFAQNVDVFNALSIEQKKS